MTNAQILKDRIKSQCELQGKSISKMLSELELGVNAINQINEKKGIGSFVLLNIANYLGCSVDYLLGRTKEPQVINQYNNGDNVNINKSSLSDTDNELISEFKKLTFTDKAKVMSLIAELSEKKS